MESHHERVMLLIQVSMYTTSPRSRKFKNTLLKWYGSYYRVSNIVQNLVVKSLQRYISIQRV